jgi:uncharacterized Zn-finger protein
MNMKRLLNDYKLSQLTLLVWLASAVAVTFLLLKIDSIVHGQLYSFQLQFSHAWADPYWETLHLIYAFIAIPAALSIAALSLSLYRRNKLHSATQTSTAGPSQATLTAQADRKPRNAGQEPEPTEATVKKPVEERARENQNAVVISCPNCQKVFSRPLVMLDFTSGKTRLINVCPYCNHKIGNAQEGEEKSLDVQVQSEDEKLKH